MNKERYNSPKLIIIEISNNDIICSSSDDQLVEWDNSWNHSL